MSFMFRLWPRRYLAFIAEVAVAAAFSPAAVAAKTIT